MKSILAVLLLFLLNFDANAADFKSRCTSQTEKLQMGCTIFLNGEIAAGDNLKLRRLLRVPPPKDWHYSTIVLSSNGGSVEESILLAKTVRDAMLKTSTTDFDAGTSGLNTCVSACFLVWVAGIERFGYSGNSSKVGRFGIGLHRPYFAKSTYSLSPTEVAAAHRNATNVIREHLRAENIPDQFVESMLERSSKEVFWLDESGDPWALNGRAHWFDEMMIAVCNYDPTYDKGYQEESVKLSLAGKKEPESMRKKYLAWRQNYNSCEYTIRRRAQDQLQK